MPIFLTERAADEMKGKLPVNKDLLPPVTATADMKGVNLPQAIRFGRVHCADTKADPLTRAVMLTWVIHNVGDAHQPLNSTALFSKRLFPKGDRGGNRVLTEKKENLHPLWDGFPGQPDHRESRSIAIALLSNKDKAAVGREAAAVLEERTWLVDSHELARTVVYDATLLQRLKVMEAGKGEVEPLPLSDDYLKASGRVAARRVVQAGFRLGAVLKEIVAN